ncbi:unnamed protein product [Clavelina lepadiformis]|uniref:Uncharacterized protein n=1 Tax=Clavelina lepadiformis TaxID=159417 RepID=A0ABP0FCT9_CLALP
MLGSALKVVQPFGFCKRQRDTDNNLKHRIQDLLKNENSKNAKTKTSLKFLRELEPKPSQTIDLEFPKPERTVSYRQQDKVSGFVHKYNKFCKTVSYLPNPVSKLLYDDMKTRALKDSELEARKKLKCHPEHERNCEPPCITYYSPIPSQVFLYKRENATRNGRRSRVQRFSDPLATVNVFLHQNVQIKSAAAYLQEFGEIGSIAHIDKRTYKVIFK